MRVSHATAPHFKVRYVTVPYRLQIHIHAPLFGEQMKKIITAVAIAAALALTGCSATDSAVTTKSGDAPVSSEAAAPSAEAPAAPAAQSPAAPAAAEPKVEDVPSDYKSALKSAENYSKVMNMSKAGVFDQLTSEYGGKFTPEAAQYAIDNVKADWNANALASAKTYQETMAMSPEAIRDQLTSEYGGKFTAEEAEYAIANLG